MVNKSKILSDLSKMAVDAMSTFAALKKEVETIVSFKVNKIINKMNLVKKDEFDVLSKRVENLENKIKKLKIKNKKKTKLAKKS